MKRFLTVTLILVLAILYFVYFKEPVQTVAQRWINVSFCAETKSFKLGEIDPRFEIDTISVYKNSIKAADIWNETYGAELIKIDINAPLTVNLIYDERQSSLTQVNDLSNQVEATKEQIEAQLRDVEQKKQDLENRINELNSRINYWNQQGGAPEEIYQQITREQSQIKRETDRYSSLTNELNSQISALNDKINNLNTNVERFNRILNIKPEGGIYDPFNKKIDIYMYSDDVNYISVLAHEFGHYIGLGHTDEPESIMYPVNTSAMQLTENDLAILQEFCRDQSRWQLFKNDFRNLVYSYLTSKDSFFTSSK